MSALKKVLEAMPSGSLVPRDWVLENLDERPPEKWVDSSRAMEILAGVEISARQLRRMAVRWEIEMAKGRRPKVRVRRKGTSHWQFDEDDLWALRRDRGPIRVEPSVEGMSADEAADRLLKDYA